MESWLPILITIIPLQIHHLPLRPLRVRRAQRQQRQRRRPRHRRRRRRGRRRPGGDRGPLERRQGLSLCIRRSIRCVPARLLAHVLCVIKVWTCIKFTPQKREGGIWEFCVPIHVNGPLEQDIITWTYNDHIFLNGLALKYVRAVTSFV